MQMHKLLTTETLVEFTSNEVFMLKAVNQHWMPVIFGPSGMKMIAWSQEHADIVSEAKLI